MPKELRNAVLGAEDPNKLFESIAFNINLGYQDSQKLLEAPHILARLSMLVAILSRKSKFLILKE